MKKIKATLIFSILTKTMPAHACGACVGRGFPLQTIRGYINATVFLAAMPFVVAAILFLVALRFRTKR